MIGNILTKFKKKIIERIFVRGMTLSSTLITEHFQLLVRLPGNAEILCEQYQTVNSIGLAIEVSEGLAICREFDQVLKGGRNQIFNQLNEFYLI